MAFGEMLVGLALILGLATRCAAAMGLPMNVAYLLAGANGVGPLMVLVEVPIMLGGAAAGAYGLDRYLLPYLRTYLSGRAWRPAPHPALRVG